MIEKDKLLTLNKKDRILVSSILDKYRQYQKTKKGVASNFLNPSEMKLVTNYLNYYPWIINKLIIKSLFLWILIREREVL